MHKRIAAVKRSALYGTIGFFLGITAPFAWLILKLVFFPDPDLSLWAEIYDDVTRNSYQLLLYSYMGFGTAIVMATLGYYIGRASDELHERALELDGLNREVASQKEIFENRYKVLDNNIKNFHSISSRIQKSMDMKEVLALCAEGLHDILGYERVNILICNDERTELHFVAATGSENFSTKGVTLPLDERSGIIFKCIREKTLFLVDDMAKYPASFHLQPPYNTIQPLRSRSFVICPIVVRGEAIGIFGIDNKFSHRTMNDTDVDTVKLFADQAASAITRVMLLGDIHLLIGELDDTFAGMLQNRDTHSRTVMNLQRSTESMTDSTTHIATASQGVLASVDETSSAVVEISVAIEQVTRNLDSLSETVDKSVSAMEQINSSLRSIQESTTVSHQVSKQVTAHSDRGRKVVDQTVDALAEIQRSVDLSYQGIKRLSENSSRIDGIVNVINDITKRTNLLALNASIIAAQAGEFGRSFGVVADEIRNLSLQTGQSTGEITGIIEEIMSESRSAADNVAATKELVRRGVSLGEDTGISLKEILDASKRALEMTEGIMTAASEQSRSVQMVTQSIEDVSTMTSQIFNASKEQSNATRNIARAISAIREMTQEMTGATGNQVNAVMEIRKSVDSVSQMVIGMFDHMEQRREESRIVTRELELMREKTM